MLLQFGVVGMKYFRICKFYVMFLGVFFDLEIIYEVVMVCDGFKKNFNNVLSILWYWVIIIIYGKLIDDCVD